MHFWTACSVIAGALRRKVWIDQAYFKWYPNLYVVIVAPPGIVSKSTTASIGMNLLRQVPDIKFGPDIVTWQALTQAFGESKEMFEYQDAYHPMCALTFEASEFGNLLDPQDKDMVDLLVSLWDGKQGEFKKMTKHVGNDSIENPWINLIACTTPSWIAQNFPEYMIGGGFTSRCIFVYADKKERLVAYPGDEVREDFREQEEMLLRELIEISKMVGQFTLTPEAKAWGRAWYEKHYSTKHIDLDPERFGGYLARKQTMMHKVAMILSAAESSDMILTEEHLSLANIMLTDLEPDMQNVFQKIGKSADAFYAERFINFVHARSEVSYQEAYRYIHSHFPSMRDFEDMVAGCVEAGYVLLEREGGKVHLKAGKPLTVESSEKKTKLAEILEGRV